MDADCKADEHAVRLWVYAGNGQCVLTPAEAEQLAADLLRASAAARAYLSPVSAKVVARNRKNATKKAGPLPRRPKI
jgi:hypothetical protein